ncbi:hypothetical protein B0H13DRAFT_2650661 [Mycena leptocephala]|nr:hypothetical protein B0H13DRAFT_2650661 [Mycena leptocephala]
MSFGLGMGDIFLVTTLTWKLYKSCKESSEDFRRMSIELCRCTLFSYPMEGCKSSLEDLDALYRRYDSLSTQAQRSWDATTMLTGFNTALINSSLTYREKTNKFITEVQAGMREGSVISDSDAATTIQSPDVWVELRRELEDVGISAVVVEERHDFIVNWLKNALADGSLEGDVVAIDDAVIHNRSFTPINSEGINSRSLTPTNDEGINSRSLSPINDVEQDSNWYHTAHNELSHDTDVTRLTTARARNERAVSELLDPLAASTLYSLPSPSSSSTLSPSPRAGGAASDGDIDRVANLISIGMDVNAVDRWGWSALSMCGYGGHMAIARLLLDHGANIDNVDVDGDTPKSLAAQRGHANLLIMLEEEEAIRKLKASEANRI